MNTVQAAQTAQFNPSKSSLSKSSLSKSSPSSVKRYRFFTGFGRSHYAGAIMGFVSYLDEVQDDPGLVLSPAVLAQRFSTNPETIRTALKRLAAGGYLLKSGRNLYRLTIEGRARIAQERPQVFEPRPAVTPKQSVDLDVAEYLQREGIRKAAGAGYVGVARETWSRRRSKARAAAESETGSERHTETGSERHAETSKTGSERHAVRNCINGVLDQRRSKRPEMHGRKACSQANGERRKGGGDMVRERHKSVEETKRYLDDLGNAAQRRYTDADERSHLRKLKAQLRAARANDNTKGAGNDDSGPGNRNGTDTRGR